MPKETLQLGVATLDQRCNSASMVKNHQHQTGCPLTLTAACGHDTMAAWPLTWAHTAPGGIQQRVGSPLHINIYSCVCVLPRLEREPSFDRHSLTHPPTRPHTHTPIPTPATAPDPRVHLPVRWPGFLWNVCSRPGVAAPSSPRAVCRASTPFPDRQPAR